METRENSAVGNPSQSGQAREDRVPRTTPETAASVPTWAFAGGKGGVGKSIVALNVATHLALTGRRVVLVDADLGAPNLQTLLGVHKPRYTLSSFVDRAVNSLEDARCDTCVKGLQLIAGSRDTYGAAHPKHLQTQKLIRHLGRLDADVVILDLGGGTSYPVLDLFYAASRKAVVVVPEPTSVQNAYAFLKLALLRSLRNGSTAGEVVDHNAVRRVLRARIEGPPNERAIGIPDLLEALRSVSEEACAELTQRIAAFEVFLVANRTPPREGRLLAARLAGVCQEFLRFMPIYAGNIGTDRIIEDSVRKMRPFLLDLRTGTRWDELTAVRETLERGGQGREGFAAATVGINEKVEVAGAVFHVQTEDRGKARSAVVTSIFRDGQLVHTEENDYSSFGRRHGSDVPVQAMLRSQHGSVVERIRRLFGISRGAESSLITGG
jgi:flagellar biosynthesis protein FlhG